jgi:DNA-binding response OmpR family regulator
MLAAHDSLSSIWFLLVVRARFSAGLRGAPAAAHPSEGYQFGEVRVDFRRAEVTKAGEPLDLSAREFQLLKYFIEHRGATLTRDELLNEVWGYNAMPSTRTVDVHVAWLRQKVEPNQRHPQYILTVHGMGYKFAG